MDKENYHDFGKAPVRAEGEPVDYEYQPRTPEDTIKYLQERLAVLRKIERKYTRLKAMARSGRLMVASKEGFTLVEDLDEYVHKISSVTPVTRKELIQEGLNQLGKAFDESYKVDPNVEYKWVKP